MKWDWKQLALVVLLMVLLLALHRMGNKRGKEGRAARMMKKYARIPATLFDKIPAGERVEAIVARVLARAEQAGKPNPVAVLAELGNSSTVVYSVWAICRELAAADAAALVCSPSWELAELAANGFRAIGAPACGDALNALRACETADSEALAAAGKALRAALETECPLSLCEDYILDHKEELTDPD